MPHAAHESPERRPTRSGSAGHAGGAANDPRQPTTRLVVGTMTGTSIDGMDAALAAIDGHGLRLRVTLLGHRSVEFPLELKRRLRAAAEQESMPARAFSALARDFAELHADVISHLLAASSPREDKSADLIVAHGQTIFHQPPVSWQLLQPAPIVARLGITTVCDLRQGDLAVGGQGAPITPLADWILFRAAHDRVIINLGGFCNMTFLPGTTHNDDALSGIRGADVCACNQVLDAVARDVLGVPFDQDGSAAARGRPAPNAVARLRTILARQRTSGRSLGTGDEAARWVHEERRELTPDDLAASATVAIGNTIGDAVRAIGLLPESKGMIALAGGGARHRGLVAAIAAASGTEVTSLEALGVPLEAREALEMAALGALAQDGVPITIAAVTGRQPARVRDGLWCYPA